MASVDERKETSLRACIAHMLDIDVTEVPKKREANMGQWLALRNLGLVPVASPESFEWPGRFLGLLSDSSTWAVFFGVPPGVIYDPMAEPDGKKEAAFDAAFVLARQDPRRGTEPASGTESVGTVELIALASEAEGPMRSVSTAEAVEGRGLLGDRYERKAGTFSKPGGRGYDLTLVEAEALEELSAKGVELAPIEARRNLVVRGIALDDLIGRRFRVGEVECYGQRRCEPCSHLEPANPDRSVAWPSTQGRAASRHTLGRHDQNRRQRCGAAIGIPAVLCCIHRSAWKGSSRNSVSTILHKPGLMRQIKCIYPLCHFCQAPIC